MITLLAPTWQAARYIPIRALLPLFLHDGRPELLTLRFQLSLCPVMKLECLPIEATPESQFKAGL
jgi:hypothetical protein